jgi:hypothetical protein
MWRPFLSQFRKYCPSDDIRVYVGSNVVTCNEPGVIPILSGEDTDWSSSYNKILTQIEEQKLLVLLDDYFLGSHVDMARLSRIVDFIFSTEAKYINCKSSLTLPPDEPTRDVEIGRYAHGVPYRATVCGFWDREYLMGLLMNGENPWDFEIMGSYRASYADGFFGLYNPLLDCRNLIEKGRWIPQSVKWAKKEGAVLNLDRRPMLKGANQIISKMKIIYFWMLLRIPWQRRVKWMNTLRRALISY